MQNERVRTRAVALLVGIPPSTAVASPVIIPIIVLSPSGHRSDSGHIPAIVTIAAISAAIITIAAISAASIIAIAAAVSFPVGIAIGRGPAHSEDIIIKVARLGATEPYACATIGARAQDATTLAAKKTKRKKRLSPAFMAFYSLSWNNQMVRTKPEHSCLRS